MRIRTEQMHELGKIYAERFVDHVTSFVRAELGGASGEVTRDAIAALIDRARAYGFTLESTIVAFVITAQLLGHDFDARLPDARGILQGPKPEELRAFELENLTLSLLDASHPEEPPP